MRPQPPSAPPGRALRTVMVVDDLADLRGSLTGRHRLPRHLDALRAIEDSGFALAGAGALVAHGLISRPTQDLDLFAPAAGGPGDVSAPLQAALADAGYQVQVLEAAEQHNGEFLRLRVRHEHEVVDMDVARDWRQHPPVRMQIGPVLHVDDAVASKVTALMGRGLPGDYIDVGARIHRCSRRGGGGS